MTRANTAHQDRFALDNLPPPESWPELVFDLPALQFPARLNCAVELLDKAIAEGHGDRPAIYSQYGTWTYAELDRAANQVAHVLAEDCGLVPGNRVLLRSANNPMLMACWFGVIKAGGIVVTTMPLLRAGELVPIIDKAEIALAISDIRLADALETAMDKTPHLKRLLTYGEGSDPANALDQMMSAKPHDFSAVDTAADDVVLLGFTSGTTGQPKACMHFHRDVMAMHHCFNAEVLKPQQTDVFCGTPPIAFTFGLGASVVFPLAARATTALIEKATPEELIAAIGRYGVTNLFTAPTAYRAMLQHIDDYDTGSLRRCISAGEALPKATWEAWYNTTGIKIIDGLGSTEMIHIFISAADDEIKPGATGKAIPGYRATVLDENDRPLPPGEVGRLAVKGPTGCRYLADDRQTKYVASGWNVTGDSYMQDEDGYFWFQARADDMIISSGYNIAGPEVEGALMTHPAVQECAVVASPDADRGNLVKAFIVLAPGHEGGPALIKDLQNHVKAEIAPYKYPRAIVFVDTLPKTQTGKIQRFVLRQQEQEQAGALAS